MHEYAGLVYDPSRRLTFIGSLRQYLLSSAIPIHLVERIYNTYIVIVLFLWPYVPTLQSIAPTILGRISICE